MVFETSDCFVLRYRDAAYKSMVDRRKKIIDMKENREENIG